MKLTKGDKDIAKMRTFVHVRRILEDNHELAKQLKQLEKKYDEQFQIVFDTIKKLIEKRVFPEIRSAIKRKNKPFTTLATDLLKLSQFDYLPIE